MRSLAVSCLLLVLLSCSDKSPGLDKPPVGTGSKEASLVSTPYGLILSWLEPVDDEIHFKQSIYNGVNWLQPQTIAHGKNWFVNWADFPAIISNGDKLFAHFLQISGASTYDYDIMFMVSNDRGSSWTTPKKLHSDSIPAEHGFVSGIPYKDGFAVAWLDGRYSKSELPRMSLRGAIIGGDGIIKYDDELDSMVCDCCQTSVFLADGQANVVYRDRTELEIRDNAQVSFSENGVAASRALHPDGWQISACPVNGPVSASSDDLVAVAWYTGANTNYEVRLKISQDGGKSFGDMLSVDSPESLGRIDVQIWNEKIYLTYLSREDNKAILMLATYSATGQLQSKVPLSTLAPDRGTGFPRTAIWQDMLVVAWTDIEEHRVKLLHIPLEDH